MGKYGTISEIKKEINLKQIQPSITDKQHQWLKEQKAANPNNNAGKLVQDGLDLLIAKQARAKK